MTWVAVAVGGAAVVGSVVGGVSASKAAGQQANASNNAAQLQQKQFNTITQQETPYMQGGYGALGNLEYLLGISPQTDTQATLSAPTASTPAASVPGTTSPVAGSWGASPGMPTINRGMSPLGAAIGGNAIRDLTNPTPPPASGLPVSGGPPSAGGFGSLLSPFTAGMMEQYSPAYQFQREQGMQGTLNGAAPGQGALSGAAQQALASFNQNYANTAFGNAFNQYQTQQGNTYNRLAGIAQLGQTSAANTGQQGTALAATEGQAISNVGTALAGGTVGVANAASSGLGSLGALPFLMNQSYTNEVNSLQPVQTQAQYM